MIRMNDFQSLPPGLSAQLLSACDRVVNSGYFVNGPEVTAFENAWARYCNCTNCVGVGNGLDALEISLRSCKVGPGDEVITTPMTAFASTLAILRAGATPVFADINPATALLDKASVDRCLSGNTKAILLVHLYGHCTDMDNWMSYCEEKELILIEDCAQAHGATWNCRKAGSFGAVGAYSFYPTKNLGAVGDAGAIITNSNDIAHYAQCLKNYGQEDRYTHTVEGMNSRLDELQAAILREKLEYFESASERRKQIAKSLRNEINNKKVRLLSPPQKLENHANHLFVILCENRDALSIHLREKGIESLYHYPVPCHKQRPCLSFKRDPRGLHYSEIHAQQCISIPCAPHLSEENVQSIALAINEF